MNSEVISQPVKSLKKWNTFPAWWRRMGSHHCGQSSCLQEPPAPTPGGVHCAKFICTVCICIGSSDPVRVSCPFHNKYTGYNWSIYCWDYVQLVSTKSNVLLYLLPMSVWLSKCVTVHPHPNATVSHTVLYGGLNSCLLEWYLAGPFNPTSSVMNSSHFAATFNTVTYP